MQGRTLCPPWQHCRCPRRRSVLLLVSIKETRQSIFHRTSNLHTPLTVEHCQCRQQSAVLLLVSIKGERQHIFLSTSNLHTQLTHRNITANAPWGNLFRYWPAWKEKDTTASTIQKNFTSHSPWCHHWCPWVGALPLLFSIRHKKRQRIFHWASKLHTPLTLMSLSMPPEKICSAVSLKATAVTWYIDWNVWITPFFLASHI